VRTPSRLCVRSPDLESPTLFRIEDLDYLLPSDRIAQAPVEPRDAARLLICDRNGDGFEDAHFSDLPARLGPHDLLVVNDSRVMPARVRARKPTGGKLELLLVEYLSDSTWRALVRSNSKLRVGQELHVGESPLLFGRIEEIEADGTCKLRFWNDPQTLADEEKIPIRDLAECCGEIPLPPYIHSGVERPADRSDYQTVFAHDPGSVAAPTASLHFTRELAARLPIARITLHVGPGTFRPIRTERIEEHRLEPERFSISEECAEAMRDARARGGRIIAVGTTVVRALETTGGAAGRGRAELLIQPGYPFRAVDALITNFHLPRSSLLALVMALGGVERIQRAYAAAIERGYRFYSYGDAMWLC